MTPEENIKVIDKLTKLARAFVKASDDHDLDEGDLDENSSFIPIADVHLNHLAIEITNYANKKLGRNLVWMDQQVGE